MYSKFSLNNLNNSNSIPIKKRKLNSITIDIQDHSTNFIYNNQYNLTEKIN
ncbi:16851_t:CDS:1, partial [Racocetra fulgida]